MRIWSLLPAALLCCTFAQAADSGFLSDYSQLRETPRRPALLTFTLPDVRPYRTSKIYLAPVEIRLSTDGYQASSADRRRMGSEMRRMLIRELSPVFKVVDVEGPDAMPLRVALTEVKMDTPGHYVPRLAGTAARDVRVSVNGQAPFWVQSATLEFEGFAPHKAARLIALVDSEPLPGAGAPVRWDRALEALAISVRRLVGVIQDQRQRDAEAKPEPAPPPER
jgi:hypothetical protein